jgi:hypothetical protein
MGFPDPNEPFTWPALLADQTGDGDNFMRRYLQTKVPASRQKFPITQDLFGKQRSPI